MKSALGEARGLIGVGKGQDALDLLSRTLRRASSVRQRIHWQVSQARFCIEQGYVSTALRLLDHLDRVIEDRDLENWEPDLACAISELRLLALTHPETQITLVEDRRRSASEHASGRLARLDIGVAARLLRP